MAFHLHQVELCMLESVILLSYAASPVKDEGTYCLALTYANRLLPFGSCQIVNSDWLSTCWTSLGFMVIIEMLFLPCDNLLAPP